MVNPKLDLLINARSAPSYSSSDLSALTNKLPLLTDRLLDMEKSLSHDKRLKMTLVSGEEYALNYAQSFQ